MSFQTRTILLLHLVVIAIISALFNAPSFAAPTGELGFSTHYTQAAADKKYPNEYFPLAVGNYWIYMRPLTDGYALLEMKVEREFERDGHACYGVSTTDTRFIGDESEGTIFFKGEDCYCEVEASIFNICKECDGRRENEQFSPSYIKINDSRTALLRLPRIIKLDARWLDLPYEKDQTIYQVIGFESVCLHELGKTFDNCAKVRKTVTYQPRMNGFEWFCPGVGLVKDETEKLIIGQEWEAAYGYLVDYYIGGGK